MTDLSLFQVVAYAFDTKGSTYGEARIASSSYSFQQSSRSDRHVSTNYTKVFSIAATVFKSRSIIS